MKNSSKNTLRNSLVERLKSRLFLTVSLIVFAFIFHTTVSIVDIILEYNLIEQKVSIQEDLNGIQLAMVNQETGLRGYINTNSPVFLEPFNSGRPQYLAYIQRLKDQTQSSDFSNTAVGLAQMEERANDWYNNYAEVQIKNMQSGNFAVARSVRTITTGKTLFDRFRSAITQLQQVSNHDLTAIQVRVGTISRLIFIC